MLDHLAHRLSAQERKTHDTLEILALTCHRMDGAEKETGKLRSSLRELLPDLKEEGLTADEVAMFFANLRGQMRHADLLEAAMERLRKPRRR